MHRIEAALTAALAVAALLLIWFDLPLLPQTVAGLILTLALPGWLAMRVWLGDDPTAPTGLEGLVYAVALGFGVQTLGLLGLSYWPGPLSGRQTGLLFGAISGLLWLVVWRSAQPPVTAAGLPAPPNPPWTSYALVIILIVAGGLRLNGLGYTEFQGDEARAVTRAAAVIQGYDGVLFLHRKGPLEILSPTATFALTGQLTEATARLPFALASLTGLLAVYLLGTRLFGPLAGCVAALLLAVDGYFIGFARIVQYQSVVLLTTAASLLLLYHLPKRHAASLRYLTLAAFVVATGTLAHYEAMLALIPATYLIWEWWRAEQKHRRVFALGVALLVGALILALFYLPYVLSPSFANTYAYLTGERIGAEPPYNHLADFFLRTTLYNAPYGVLLQLALTSLALGRLYRRGLPAPWSWIAIGLLVGGLGISFYQPAWLILGGRDGTILFFGMSFALAWGLPRVERAERLLWIWFGLLVILALFLVAKPRTHVYVFFIPWVLLTGMTIQRLSNRLAAQTTPRLAQTVTAAALALALSLFGNYAYWYFAHTGQEIFRNWHTLRPSGYWTPYAEPDTRSLFGFPIRNGWKAVGVLYARGDLNGAYTTNDVDEWVTDWYTRSAPRCLRDHRYVIVADHLDHTQRVRKEALLAQLPPRYSPRALVLAGGEPRLQIWQQGDPPVATQQLDLASLSAIFDAELSGPNFPLTAPAVEPAIEHPQRIAFGDAIQLEGYALTPTPVSPGHKLALTLYWRAVGPIENRYRVITQLVDAAGTTVARAEGEPACDARPTDDWPVGELIVDPYELPLPGEAPPADYVLYVELVDLESGLSLPQDGAGLRVGPVRVGGQ